MSVSVQHRESNSSTVNRAPVAVNQAPMRLRRKSSSSCFGVPRSWRGAMRWLPGAVEGVARESTTATEGAAPWLRGAEEQDGCRYAVSRCRGVTE